MAAALAGCGAPLSTPTVPSPSPTTTTTTTTALAAPTKRLVLLAGGDVELGRAMGKLLLRDPTHDPFAPFAALFATADIRFVNLEGPLSDQHGETMSPVNPLIFTGPPIGADALARGHVTFASTANNHAWDYGKRGLVETLDNLDRVGVAHAGTGRTRDEAQRAVVVEKNGVRVAFLAVTDVFNFGPLAGHEADEYVARADPTRLGEAITSLKARGDVDLVVVSYHGGDEYNDAPLTRARSVLHAAIDAGADAVLGHHPHVIQAIEWYRGRPILYSMGNMLMQMHRDHPWTGYGYLARLTFEPSSPVKVEACPFRIVGLEALPFAGDPRHAAFESVFFAHLREVSSHVAPLKVDPPQPDGCALVEAP